MNDIMRTIGYQPAYHQNGEEVSIIRLLGRSDYPRFHAYIKEEGDSYAFNLHLDQKKPSYEGSTGHSGEYDGELIEEEAARIQEMLR